MKARNVARSMELEGSFPCSLELALGLYPEPHQSSHNIRHFSGTYTKEISEKKVGTFQVAKTPYFLEYPEPPNKPHPPFVKK
jgi:hypothetical protein